MSIPADITDWFKNIPTGLKVEKIEWAGARLTVRVSGTPTVASDEVMQIVIPADALTNSNSDVTVAANPNAKYAITTGSVIPTEYDITVTGGTASASKAVAGTEITLTVDESAVPAGKVFDEWEVASGGVAVTDGKFTMPESNVVIKAAYKDASVQPDEGEEDGNEPSSGNEGEEPKKPEPNDGGKEDVIAKTGDDAPFAGLFATVAAAGIAVLALRRRIA